MPEERRGQTVGWYVEIPKSLRDEFDRLYPGKRHKKILTITAIQRAIRLGPQSLYNLYRESPVALELAEGDVQRSGADSTRGEEAFSRRRDDHIEPSAIIGRRREDRSGEDRKVVGGD